MQLTNFQKISFGLGGGVNAIKTDFFVFYLGFFYLSVVGLNPLLTGTAIFLALIFDAINDPLIGSISDRFSSKFGRRHYLMMVALVPISISYLCLFIPNLFFENQIFLFFWLFGFATLTRFFVTLFDIPHRALATEIPDTYEDKGKIMTLREGFQAIIALSHSFIILPFISPLLRSETNPIEWINIGAIGAVLIVIFGITSIFGTLKLIPKLSEVSAKKSINPNNWREIFRDIKFALSSKTLLIFLGGSVLIQAGWGLANSLTFLSQIHFWNLTPNQIQNFVYVYFLSVILSWIITPRLINIFEKHHIVIGSLIIIGTFQSIPFIFYSFGILTELSSENLLFFLAFNMIFTSTFAYVSLISRESMVPDMVDKISKNSDFRRDGSVSSVTSFCAKCMSGFGQFFSMFVLWLISFPSGMEIEPSKQQEELLGFFQGPFIFIIFLLPIFVFYYYPLTRAEHRKIKLN